MEWEVALFTFSKIFEVNSMQGFCIFNKWVFLKIIVLMDNDFKGGSLVIRNGNQ